MKRATPAKSPKPRCGRCKVCHDKFEKTRSIQPTCEKFECKVEYASRVAAKAAAKRVNEAKQAAAADRANDRKRKEALKSQGDWIADVQVVFNRYIRVRDADKTCICCGKPFEPQRFGGSMDAGHYRSRGSAPHLRFDERNVHGQRKNCNRPGGTTHAAFRAGMIARIGLETLEALEADQTPRHYTIEDLKALKKHYQAKTRELLKARS
jgi:hypothetical protein